MRGSPVRARPEDEPRLLPHNRFLKTLLLARFCNRNRNATGIPSRNYHFRKVAGWNSAALTHCLSTHRRLHLVGWRNIAITLTTPESLATGRLVAKREVLWIFRQHCQLDTFQRRFHSTSHEIMILFSATTRPSWRGYQPLAVYNPQVGSSATHFSAAFSTPRIRGSGDHDVFLARRQDRFGFASVERETDRHVPKRER